MLAQLNRLKEKFIEICRDLWGDNSLACDVLAQLDRGASHKTSHTPGNRCWWNECRLDAGNTYDRGRRIRKKDAGNGNECKRGVSRLVLGCRNRANKEVIKSFTAPDEAAKQMNLCYYRWKHVNYCA